MKKGVDYTGVTIVFCCHDGQGRFVMARRSNNCRDEIGRWDIGGGGLEFDEKVEEALRREVKEEYCADVINYEFLGVRDVHRENRGERTHWIALDWLVQVDPREVQIGEPEKLDKLKWFKLGAMPETKTIHSQLPFFLKKYKDRLRPELKTPVLV